MTEPSSIPDPGDVAAAPIRTLAAAAAQFTRFGSPRVLAAGLILSTGARAGLAIAGHPLGPDDLVAVLVVASLVPFVEWFVHRVVLHARPRRLAGIAIDPGAGHREHHDNPSTIDRVLLHAVDATLFQVVNALVAAAVIGGPLWLAGRPVAGPTTTAAMAAIIALAHYEWSHFLFHTAYRPRTARYRRLKANHLRHHWRDDRAWLGVTTNLADRLTGTLPETGSVS